MNRSITDQKYATEELFVVGNLSDFVCSEHSCLQLMMVSKENHRYTAWLSKSDYIEV